MNRLASLTLLALLAGCTSMTKPVTIQEALSGVEKDLIAANALSVSASTLTDPAEASAFDADILVAQCSQSKADPEVALLNDKISIKLTGSFSAGAGLSVNGIGGQTLGGISGSVDRDKGQEIDIPVEFMVLSQLPDTVAQTRLEIAAHSRMAQITAARDALQVRVDTLIAGFTASACTKAQTSGSASALMTLKARRR